ncbi:MAG TPA: DUF2092 domain-containing protein [Candidatus Binataceae bacterium]|nr:DUF2092 domain-containing protein [Candidatus Binataceae bacterium]
MRKESSFTHTLPLMLFALLITTGYTCSQALAGSTASGGSSPAAVSTRPSPGHVVSPAGPQNAPLIDPMVRQVLNGACHELASAKTMTYHAEITFDSVLPSGVKIQYAAAMDAAIKRPDHLAISYKSDLGAKAIWYDGKTLTIYDPSHRVYASTPAADSIEAMFKQVAEEKNLSIPLEGFDFNDECGRAYRDIQRAKYISVNDADGVDCDHLGFIQQDADWQLWVDHTGKPLPRKIVITYKKLPSQPQWSATFSNWRFNQNLPASLFQAKIPKGVIRASFMGVKEKQQ